MAASVVVGFVIMIIILALGGSLLGTMQTSMDSVLLANNATAHMAAGNGSAGLLSFAAQSTNIGLVIGITIILTILIVGLGAFLYTRGQD